MAGHETKFTFCKQKDRIKIESKDTRDALSHKKSTLLPANVRAIICSPSHGGKTTIMLSLLESVNGLKFLNLYLFSPSINQPKYVRLYQVLSRVPGLGVFFNPDVSQLDILPFSCVVLDDCQAGSMYLDLISRLFSHGRHSNIDVFYLVQSYAKVPKHLIRDNCNLICALRQDSRNLSHIFQDHCFGDMDYPRFLSMTRQIWQKPFGFLVISTECDINSGKYRCGFDTFVTDVVPKNASCEIGACGSHESSAEKVPCSPPGADRVRSSNGKTVKTPGRSPAKHRLDGQK